MRKKKLLFSSENLFNLKSSNSYSLVFKTAFFFERRMKVRLRSLVFWSISCLYCFRWIVEVLKTAYRLGVKCTSDRRGLSFMFRYSILSVSFSSTLVICRLYDFSPFPYKYLVIVAALKCQGCFLNVHDLLKTLQNANGTLFCREHQWLQACILAVCDWNNRDFEIRKIRIT